MGPRDVPSVFLDQIRVEVQDSKVVLWREHSLCIYEFYYMKFGSLSRYCNWGNKGISL